MAIIFLHTDKDYKDRLIAGFLGFLWIWVGIVYHISFFTDINNAAYGFGILFFIQGILFIVEGFRKKIEFSLGGKTAKYAGYFFILFGLIIYPVIGFLIENSLLKTISLGLPCPTTILTFGFLMLTKNKFSKYLLIIPTLWAIIGTGAAIQFEVYQDYIMLVAAIIADIYLIRRKKKRAVKAIS
jgi:hypothetical protein